MTAAALHDKFAVQSFTLQLGDLDTFFGGLEGLVGAPDPKVYQAMEREHNQGADSVPFNMPNGKARTTSAIEWRFVACPDKGADGFGSPFEPYPGPANSRQALPFAHFEAELARLNGELSHAGFKQTVGKDEFIAARLYTGPMYLKYNSVLRGLLFAFAQKSLEELCRGNKYATTLHVINSAIIKLSRLTQAAKVYRGVSGGVLPEACRTANAFGVKGGVEGGFMSTTTDKTTASFYARGGADKSKHGSAAILFEAQMGMVDRGADVGWLSEFPHESEILFAPLTGMEVRGARVEGAMQVYEVVLTCNMASLTLEQVLSKRRKVVMDMCEQLVLRARLEARSARWRVLRCCAADDDDDAGDGGAGAGAGAGDDDGDGGAPGKPPRALEAYLAMRLTALAVRPPEVFNENAPLGETIVQAVAAANLVADWPVDLAELAEAATLNEQKRRDACGHWEVVVVGERASSAEALVRWGCEGSDPEAPLAVSLNEPAGRRHGEAFPAGRPVRIAVVRGLCALVWAMQARGVPLAIDLNDRRIGSDGLAALGLAIAPSVVSLDLRSSGCTADGLAGLHRLCSSMSSGLASGLRSLRLASNRLEAEGARLLADALPHCAALRSLDLASAELGSEGCELLAAALPRMPTEELDLSHNHFGTRGAAALAAVLPRTQIRTLRVALCSLKAEGFAALVPGLSEHATLTALDLRHNFLHVDGAAAVGALLAEARPPALAELVLDHCVLCGLNFVGRMEGTYDVAGVVAIAKGLERCRDSLAGCSVAHNELGPEATAALCAALRGSAALTSLDVGHNGAAWESDWLSTSELELCGGEAAFELGARVIHEGREMILSRAVDDDGDTKVLDRSAVDAVAACLRDCPRLAALNLPKNGLTQLCAAAIADCLKGAACLTSLDLSANDLGPSGGASVARALHGHPTLSTLRLADNALVRSKHIREDEVEGDSKEVGDEVRYRGLSYIVRSAPDDDGDLTLFELAAVEALVGCLQSCTNLAVLGLADNRLNALGRHVPAALQSLVDAAKPRVWLELYAQHEDPARLRPGPGHS